MASRRSPFINESVSKLVEPILINAEVDIKVEIKKCLLYGVPFDKMQKSISKIIDSAIKELPIQLNKAEYKAGLISSSMKWYKILFKGFEELRMRAKGVLTAQGKVLPKTTMGMIKAIDRMPNATYQRYRYVGYPNVDDYQQKMNEAINQMSRSPLENVGGQRKMTLFAKTELDLRHQAQMEKLEQKKSEGKTLQRFSQHASCSERCEPWQGKLVDLYKPPINSSMWTGEKYKGEKIYSYTGITSKVDEYGYQNNIYVGFNCRHKLLDPDRDIVIEYTKEEIEKDRELNAKSRQMERYIRNAKKTYLLSEDKEEAKKWRLKSRQMTAKYREFTKKNDMVYYEWRIAVPRETIKKAR